MTDDVAGNQFTGAPVSLLDSFTPPADKFGRISGTFLNVSGSLGPFVDYFLVDTNHAVFIETDLISRSSNQVALGYFAKACDVTSSTSCQTAAARFPAEYALDGRSSLGVEKTK